MCIEDDMYNKQYVIITISVNNCNLYETKITAYKKCFNLI